MRYDDPDLRDRLAAEYVLGTLHGMARRRFERLMLRHVRLRATVHAWERRLGDWILRLPPETPPPRVWRAIQSRIAPAPVKARWWLRLAWPAAALSAAAALGLLLVVVLTRPVVQEPDYLAVVSSETGTTLWSITADVERAELLVRAVNPQPPGPGKDLELWLLPDQAGEKPLSLGLMPRSGTAELRLPAGELPPGPAKLAITVEPAGGSPTGLPTGPVVYQAPLLRL